MTLGDFIDYLVWMSLYELSGFSGSHRQGEKKKQRRKQGRRKRERERKQEGEIGREGMEHLLLLKPKWNTLIHLFLISFSGLGFKNLH